MQKDLPCVKIIIINSPIGVGKTTIGKYIAEKYEGIAFIDGDWRLDIHHVDDDCFVDKNEKTERFHIFISLS